MLLYIHIVIDIHILMVSIRFIRRDGEPRTATSAVTQLLSSERKTRSIGGFRSSEPQD